mgnify:CR=1 FL=1|tara:strand:+ start:94 stop:465 length:372 start_codon:yes stop_codon:yes gene_type:complete
MKTIKENMDAFQKQMWSHEKPLEFSVQVVEELLLEVQRQRTVMRAALEEIDAHWEQHSTNSFGEPATAEEHQWLVNLMDNLGYRQNGMYPKFLSPEAYEEYLGRLHNELDFAKIAEDIENGEE